MSRQLCDVIKDRICQAECSELIPHIPEGRKMVVVVVVAVKQVIYHCNNSNNNNNICRMLC